ncbi:MAG: hemerythrin [Bacteroidetes bacterium]|nr:hemerythrin [Bacteroidota bacterium]
MESKTFEDLIETNKMYQLVTERLEVVDPDAQNLYARFNMEAELMELILDFYNQEDDHIASQKLHKFSPEQVLAYLQASHKLYLSKKLPEIEQTMVHIFNKYGQTHALLTTLTVFFNDYKNRLIEHIRSEEKDFFPFIKKLIAAEKGELTTEQTMDLMKSSSLEDYTDNHGPIEDDLKNVSVIIQDYSKNQETPLPYRVFLNQVEIFEMELRKHAIIEDHVLVPMARELEKILRERLNPAV